MNESVLLALVKLLLADVLFVAVLVAVVAVLAYVKRASYAVLRRNFVGYFTNPTGYVFLCIFVFLTSLAAFWPYEFFNANLATLDQLNQYLPLIMLFFIPAITMSIWAEERRQGTDELLLTLPADDFDIVIGKYLAAGAIFTASLLFSQIATFFTLAILTYGDLDIGLFFTTYLGYWFVGMTMIAIGMVASFLTGNLTVGFILGALFNAPLAFASYSDAIVPDAFAARVLEAAGLGAQFDDFGRGVISLSSAAYFALVAAVGLYLCMVLIGRRHWTGGKDGNTMAWHYLGRVLALVVITGGAVVLFNNKDYVRIDATDGRVSSLSPATKRLIRELDPERPIVIDAFISDRIPEQYARTRYELVNLLKEFRAEAAKRGGTLRVNLHQDIELFSDEAALAEERFGIQPVRRTVRSQGAIQNEEIILGAVFRSGLEKVVVPFFESGIPVEYELVRSITTVAEGGRKKLGLVQTDAQLMGGFTMAGMSPQQIEKHPLVSELEKQYDVEEVELNAPLEVGQYDVLLAVQPSSLAPEQFDRLVEAVEAGVPAALFEDPLPVPGGIPAPGTGEPKQSPGGMFGGGQQTPKGEIRKLWDALELEIPGAPGQGGGFNPHLVWQPYNPYPKLAQVANELWLFLRDESGAEDALSDANPITSGAGMQEVLMLYCGAVGYRDDGRLRHTPLATTSPEAGLIPVGELRANADNPMALQAALGPPTGPQHVAVAIEGGGNEAAAEDGAPEEGGAGGVRAVYVADSDVMLRDFLQIRATRGQIAEEIDFRFDNVTFVLNVVDWLAGEMEYIEVRKHQPRFSTLRMIERIEDRARSVENDARAEAQEAFDQQQREAEEKNQAELRKVQRQLEELRERGEDGRIDLAGLNALQQEYAIKQESLQRSLDIRRARLEDERDKIVNEARREADREVQETQNAIKFSAVAIPCLPPLIIGVFVFASRRLRERENISKARLK